MKHIKYIFLLSIIFFACDEINPVNDFSNDYTFICVLKNDQPIQKAYLYKAMDIKGDISPANAFIPDAEIIISDGMISSQLQVRNFESYNPEYSDDSVFYGKILPNTKYDLQIKVNNEIVTGSTTTPGEFAINRPSNDTILYQDTNDGYSYIHINWSKSANSFQYLVYSTIKYRSNDGEEWEHVVNTNTANTSFGFEPIYTYGTFQNPTLESPGEYVEIKYYAYQVAFTVYAVDKNYYDYNILKRDRAGLSAQYGVFGSAIVASCNIYVKY